MPPACKKTDDQFTSKTLLNMTNSSPKAIPNKGLKREDTGIPNIPSHIGA
jgi:hypothetical protein